MTRSGKAASGFDTRDRSYTERLLREESRWWKRLFDVQALYRFNLNRLDLGFTLDLGCGLGRNLRNIGGNGVGIDHNPDSIRLARGRGFAAFTPAEFERSEFNRTGRFDSILFSHVAEHMRRAQAVGLLGIYLPLLRAGGRVVVITPQEAGFRSDPSHVEFMDSSKVKGILTDLGLMSIAAYSFPFPRLVGRAFKHNEFIVIGSKPGGCDYSKT